MLQPAETNSHAKMCEKLRKRILAPENLTKILRTSHQFITEKCEMYQTKTCNLSLLSILEREKNALKRPEPLSKS